MPCLFQGSQILGIDFSHFPTFGNHPKSWSKESLFRSKEKTLLCRRKVFSFPCQKENTFHLYKNTSWSLFRWSLSENNRSRSKKNWSYWNQIPGHFFQVFFPLSISLYYFVYYMFLFFSFIDLFSISVYYFLYMFLIFFIHRSIRIIARNPFICLISSACKTFSHTQHKYRDANTSFLPHLTSSCSNKICEKTKQIHHKQAIKIIVYFLAHSAASFLQTKLPHPKQTEP